MTKLLNSNSFASIEVVVRDNCSDDNTEEIFKGFDDSRLTYVRSQANEGWSTFFEAAKMANGRLLTWLSDEDDFKFENLQDVLSIFDRNKLCTVLFGGVIVGPMQTHVRFPETASFEFDSMVQDYALAQHFSGCGGLVVSRKAFEKISAFSFRNQMDAYLRQNYYPIGYIASRCIRESGRVFTTSLTLVQEARHAPTTDNWSDAASLSSKRRLLQPHYYPKSVRDRLVSQIVFVLETRNLGFREKFRLLTIHITVFTGHIRSLGEFDVLGLLRANYPEESVNRFILEVQRLHLDGRLHRRLWLLTELCSLPYRVAVFKARAWRKSW